jgi:deazaflavin-dependent oxidoreductase (nitroreductase family)
MAQAQPDPQPTLIAPKRPAQLERARGTGEHRRPMLRSVARVLNPIIKALAGRWGFPLFVVVSHRGRRSGRVFRTPVTARMTAGGFVVPLTFGQGADWYQNLLAANTAVIQWNGVGHPVSDPEVVDWATGSQAFHPLERFVMRRLGVRQFVRVRHAAVMAAER